MPNSVNSAFGRIVNALREFSVAQRTLALIGVAVLIVGSIALGAWLTRSTYSPLFTGLGGSDASAIVDQLDANGVPYQLSDGGATIMVPDTEVNGARLNAAAAGLPSLDSGGYTLLDTMGVTASEFQQSVTYKRAIEGELASTIGSIEGVSQASVQLAIPKESVFTSEKNDPTASVFIQTSAGATLTTDQVQAITHLTAAAVDGLTPENVAVISADGTVLSAVGTGATGTTDQQASTYEDRVRSSVQAMLDQVVGAGNATVVVAADMSLSSAQRVEETFTAPEGDPTLSESTSTQNFTGTGGAAGGVLGPDNIAVPTGTGTGDGTYTSDTATKNNAINKVTETTTIPAGQVTRQTISVAVNSDVVTSMDAATIRGLVEAAAGVDTTRGDDVQVELVSFTKPDATEAAAALAAAAAQEQQNNIVKIITTAVPFVGVALVLIILLSAFRGKRRKKGEEELDLGAFAASRESMEATALAVAAAAANLPIAAAPPATPVTPASPAYPAALPGDGAENESLGGIDRMRLEIDALAAVSPERTADYLRGLMDDRTRA
jgi:flagellar M-ring protein FliF